MRRIRSADIIKRIDRHLYDPKLSPEKQLRKRWVWLWIVYSFFVVSIVAILFLTYWKAWPIAWSGFTMLGGFCVAFILFPRVHRFDIVFNAIYTIIIVVSFIVTLQLGGFPSSIGVTFIGLNNVLGSMLAGNIKWTIGMFILYIITIILISILQPYLETPEYITPEFIRWGTGLMIAMISTITLTLVIFFMKDHQRMEKAEAIRLKKMDEAKTMLYTNVSHEFRTPLTVIQGIADQIEKHPEKWQNKGPAKISSQVNILLRLVNQMLDISRLEAESMPLEMIHGDLREYIKYMVSSFQSLADKNEIGLEVITPVQPVLTDYDPEKLMHVLSNLISNAMKFTNPEGKVVITLTENNKQGEILIAVNDTGRGIPTEETVRIFERFYQVPDANDQTPGTGLGLALTRELVKLMKGKIDVQSEPGKGSQFTVTLPISNQARAVEDHGISVLRSDVTAHVSSPGTKAHPVAEQSFTGEKPSLLIVEDNRDVIEYLVTILEDHYSIVHASNGKAGLDKARELIPDIILSDVMMPGMDGFEMLQHLREDILTDHIPLVLITARGDTLSKLEGLETGADHYLVKPFNEKELFLKLNNLLEARRKMQQKFGTRPFEFQSETSYRQESNFISNINNLLDEHLPEEDFNIKALCLALHMSRPQLYRKFSALTNNSIGKYIRSYRLNKAKIMIEKEGKNVSEAAMDSGFKNLSHFSASFKEEFGYAPSNLI